VLTRAIAHRLLALDASEDRATDVFVSYVADRRSWVPNGGGFRCPRCGGDLDSSDRCSGYGHRYEAVDGMPFRLPHELDHIRRNYSRSIAATVPAESL
jgi:hypothetical protein